MTVVFAALFIMYSRYKIKWLELGGGDEEIGEEYSRAFAKFSRRRISDGGKADAESFTQTLNKRGRVVNAVVSVLYALIAVFALFLLTVAITSSALKANGGQFYLGNNAYFVVQTSSMSYKEEKNPYYDDLPDNQIERYSFISVNKTDSVELYDIVAYSHDGTVYVHRVVDIYEEGGIRYYTAMGDTNNVSLSFEKSLTDEDLIGVYTGYSSLGLGRAISFLRSGTGLFAVSLAAALLVFYDIARLKINKVYDKRVGIVVGGMSFVAEPAAAREERAPSLREGKTS